MPARHEDNGVRVDVDKAEQCEEEQKREISLLKEIKEETGRPVEPWVPHL